MASSPNHTDTTVTNNNVSETETNLQTTTTSIHHVVPSSVSYAKPFPDISKIEMFDGKNFRRWQERVFSILDIHGVATALTYDQPISPADPKALETWIYANKVCRHTIISTLSNDLFDVYCSYKEAKEIWNSLNLKYTAEDAGKQKFVIGNYYKWEMLEEKDIKQQINEYHKLLEDLKGENITLPEAFVAGLLIEKLPESWKDYKQQLKHKHKQLSLADLITHIIIEDTNRKELKVARAKAMGAKANLVQNKKRYAHNKDSGHSTFVPTVASNPSFKKKGKGHCFVCGKSGHYASVCRHRKRNEKPSKPNVNLVQGDDIIAAVVSQALMIANVRQWVVDSGATRHICADRSAFTSYTSVGEGEEEVYLGDSRTASVLGKGKVLLKLTYGKTLSLSEVLHVPSIRANLVSVALLGKVGVKVTFESDKIVMTKNNVFVGKGYCDQGLFVLNIDNMNEIVSSSVYLIDSYDMWHARLGHVSLNYIKKMQALGLISGVSNACLNKCEICLESKSTKKSHNNNFQRETELLNLIHTDLGDLKQTITRGGKKYYVTFIDDFSRYVKVYLLKNKDEAFDMFLLYKAEVENQLEKKIKRVRSDRGGEYILFNDYCEKEGIIHEVTPPYAERKNRTLKEMLKVDKIKLIELYGTSESEFSSFLLL
ncbi:hypothetical protein RIF29_00393 [Crotalaria pallida]|uniref:Retrovirus-related Pol polyprotein from transposon TNT 1-94 n=1 Tax=Crotalaria pallida TaxID=3830 RepID=A0AAN9P704_CROPI